MMLSSVQVSKDQQSYCGVACTGGTPRPPCCREPWEEIRWVPIRPDGAGGHCNDACLAAAHQGSVLSVHREGIGGGSTGQGRGGDSSETRSDSGHPRSRPESYKGCPSSLTSTDGGRRVPQRRFPD